MTSIKNNDPWILKAENLEKTFHIHTGNNQAIAVLDRFKMKLFPGESIALKGPSGSGKSTVLRLLYGNYKTGNGSIYIRHRENIIIDMANAAPNLILDIRKWTIGYVSQFLRVIPRVSALDIVMDPLKMRNINRNEAKERAELMLSKVNIPEKLWGLPPSTFSGGEQQRVNIARGFVVDYPVMILDEPTASLDPENTETVRSLINESRNRGIAIIGIYHSAEDRKKVATQTIEMVKPAALDQRRTC